jgi:redox-sensitive bicupin YhaK (pirin superfamily)
MTAGGGILHIETPPESLVLSGGLFHGIQLWVNLPAADKMISPAYQNLEPDLVRLVSSADGASLLRIIAGEVDGHAGPGSTRTPIVVAHATVQPGSRLTVPWPAGYNALAYALSGTGSIGADAAPITGGQLAVLVDGAAVTVVGPPSSASAPLEVLLLGGQPIREPVVAYGPFVMNTKAQVAQAMDDFNAGRLGVIPNDALMPYRPRR